MKNRKQTKKILSILFLFLLYKITYTQELPISNSQFYFIENKGQWPEQVNFQTEVPGGFIWLEKTKIIYQFKSYPENHSKHLTQREINHSEPVKQHVVWSEFVGSNKNFTIYKSEKSRDYYNYFLGNDNSKWASKCYSYGDITYQNIYEGIDLRIYEKKLELKYDFILKPNAKNTIQLKYSGQDNIKINQNGNLEIKTSLGKIIEEKPFAYQILNGKIIEVPCKFKLKNSILSFQLAAYNKSQPLIIDPVLIFASYSGSYSDNFGMTATYDNKGNMFSGGMAFGNNYPTTPGAYDENSTFPNQTNSTTGITDVVITKYNSDGSSRIYSTYIGGGTNTQGTETVHSMIVDQNENLYIFGVTSSQNFPTTNGAYDNTFNGGNTVNFNGTGTRFSNNGTDIYVTKLNPQGTQLLASTYIGGSQNDGINYNSSNPNTNDTLYHNYGDYFRGEIMLDDSNNVYIGTCTRSIDFPIKNGYQSTMNGVYDGVVFKLDNNLENLVFSTYLGGSSNDAIYSVKLNENKEVVVVGGTSSIDFPTTNGSYEENYQGGKADGFISILSNNGLSMVASTFIGTSKYDQNYFVELDKWNNIFTIGQTNGSKTISPNVYSNPNSGQFLTKFSPNLSALELYTEFGNADGEIDISPSAFLVDFCGNVYVSGWGARINPNGTPMTGMPVSSNAFQSTSPNGFDFYLIVLSRNFENLLYGSYIGGNKAREHVDGGTSRFDKNGVVYQSVCGGCGGFSDFPTTSGVVSDSNRSNNCNNLVFKFDFEIIPKAKLLSSITEGCAPLKVEFKNFSSDSTNFIWIFGDGDSSSTIYNPTHTYNTPGIYEVELQVTDTICSLTDTATVKIIVHDSLLLDVSKDTVVCGEPNFSLTANSFGTATQYLWSTESDFSDTVNNFPNQNTIQIQPTEDITYYIQIKNPWCTLSDSVKVVFVESSISLKDSIITCKDTPTEINAINQNLVFTFDYQWLPSENILFGQGSNTVSVQVSDSMYIYLTATANNGCVVKDSIWISTSYIDSNLVEALAENDTIPLGTSVKLFGKPNGLLSYSWLPTESLNNSSFQNPIATPNSTTNYLLVVSDGFCIDSAQVKVVTVEYLCDFPTIFVPNSFTPNGDGENDILYVRGKFIQSMQLKIFNRWGELVFESSEQNKGWNGSFKGSFLAPDTYVYHLKVDCGNGENLIKGNITILK